MKHRFHPAARLEYREQVLYYDSRRRGLGTEFVVEVERAIVRVCAGPERYRVEVEPDIRSLAVARFPIRLINIVIEGTVQMLAIAHSRRRSGYRLGRK